MAIRVGINGFGRIGRNILRAALPDKELDIVAVNDITDAATLAHLLKYDSLMGNLSHEVRVEGDTILVAGRKVTSDNPWEATTLEWQTPTPPPHGNFDRPMEVHRGPYEYSVPGQSSDFTPQNQSPTKR